MTGRSPLGQLGDTLDGLMARGPRLARIGVLTEALSRLGAQAAGLFSPAHATGAESRLRGILLGSSFGARKLRIDRGVVMEGARNVHLEDEVSLYGGVFLSATGEHGQIQIGARTHIDRNSVLYGQGGITIGRACAIAGGVLIYSQTNRFDLAPESEILTQGTRYAPVRIGDDVWIGAGAVLLPGITVGDHAVVAAGAVVNREVEPWKVVGGVPAKVLRDRRD